MEVHYRHVPSLDGNFAVSAVFRGEKSSAEEIVRRLEASQEKRRTTQPSAKSAGCIFKNPAGCPAGKLVDELGLKGSRVGDARVSEVHGNLIVNEGAATATEVLELIGQIQTTARQERGIELETEVQIVGEGGMIDLAGKKIAVLQGGPGSERAVSFATGAGIAQALSSLGADISEVDVENASFALPNETELAFIALHGTFGEDGQVQQILEDRGVPYTGEGVAQSRLAFDKIASKEEFTKHGVATPHWEIIRVGQQSSLPLPYVIKAPRQGSTVGIHIVKEQAKVAAALSDAAQYDSELLIEQFIPGRELTIGVLGDLALPVLEIIPKSGFYDFNDKYPFLNPQGGGGAQHVCPAQIPADLTGRIQDLALLACGSLGLKVYSRVDVMLSERNEPFVLEINTIPGMTETSLLPDAAAVAGITYPQLCARIVELSLAARAAKK